MELIEYLKEIKFFSKQEVPFFIYDHSILESSILRMKHLFSEAQEIFFSVKANPNPQVLEEIFKLGLSFDVSSLFELKLVLGLDIPQNKVTFSGPAKTDETLNEIKKLKLKSIHVDSVEEFYALKDSSCELSLRVPLEENFSEKLGIPTNQLVEILSKSKNRFNGIHIYLGRERAQKEIIEKNFSIIKKLAKDYAAAFKGKPNLYWGGGLPVQDFLEKDMIPVASDFNLHIEAGRAICHQIGFFGTQVLSVKTRHPVNVMINGGFQYTASKFSSPQYGQKGLKSYFFNSNNEMLKASGPQAQVYGSLGIWNDLLAEDIQIPADLKRGDWILANPAGVYGPSAGANQFLGPDPVQEYYFKNGKLQISESPLVMSYLESGLDESRKTK